MKTKTKNRSRRKTPNNPVAKHAGKFNRAAKHRDKKKALKRGDAKHRRRLIDHA